ncbi:MAG: glycosyltransferase family 4 protein [Bacteroidales bacterium]|jgi:glycosyltransferase involved in cell wall biosynthesis|nr:glycosyltransferase family 4 protein [Bacteroidales bacterium]
MKILMILEGDFPFDTRVEKEMYALNNAGHEVHLACYTQKNRSEYEKYANYIVHRKSISAFIHKSSVGCLKFPFYFNFWRKFVNELFNNENFDAIHIHDLPLAKIGLEVKIKYKIPFILDLHENWPASLEIATHTNSLLGKLLSSNKQWRKYEKDMVQKADAIITVIEEMSERIEKLNIESKKIHVVSNTLETSKFKLPNLKPDSNYITLFYAGGINIHRGLQIIIKGLEKIRKKHTNVRLWIVGAGSYVEKLKQQVKNLNIEDNVNFFGWRNVEEISHYLMKSDIALIPHLRSEQTDNSSPNKLYQYMYANKPILASNCSSIKRIVEKENVGLIYNHDDVNDLVKHFDVLLEKIGSLNKGENRVKNEYSWDISGRTLIKLYKEFEKPVFSN